jgi:hypothetical protein
MRSMLTRSSAALRHRALPVETVKIDAVRGETDPSTEIVDSAQCDAGTYSIISFVSPYDPVAMEPYEPYEPYVPYPASPTSPYIGGFHIHSISPTTTFPSSDVQVNIHFKFKAVYSGEGDSVLLDEGHRCGVDFTICAAAVPGRPSS